MIAYLRIKGEKFGEYADGDLTAILLRAAELAVEHSRSIEATGEDDGLLFTVGYTGLIEWTDGVRAGWQPAPGCETLALIEDTADNSEWLIHPGGWLELMKRAAQMAAEGAHDVLVKRMPHNDVLATVKPDGSVRWHDAAAQDFAYKQGWRPPLKEATRIDLEYRYYPKTGEPQWILATYYSWLEAIEDLVNLCAEEAESGYTEPFDVRRCNSHEDVVTLYHGGINVVMHWHDLRLQNAWLQEFDSGDIVYCLPEDGDDPELFILAEVSLHDMTLLEAQDIWPELDLTARAYANQLNRMVKIMDPKRNTSLAAAHPNAIALEWLDRDAYARYGSIPVAQHEPAEDEFAVHTAKADVVEVRWEEHETPICGMRVTKNGSKVLISYLSKRTGNWSPDRMVPAGAWTAIVTALA